MSLPFKFWYDNTGRLHIEFPEDTVFHFRGHKIEEVTGGSLSIVEGKRFERYNELHLNYPENMDQEVQEIFDGQTGPDDRTPERDIGSP